MKYIIKYKNILLIILIVIMILISLFINPRYYGHDTIFHISNIYSLSKTISFNNLTGDNILLLGGSSFGYGTYLFYPKLPHLLASYIYIFTNDIYISMNIIYLITTIISSVLIYILSKKIFKEEKVAVLSAIIYLTIPYHICDIYIRDAFAENFMFLVFPLVILGIYNLRDNNDRSFYIPFILGYAIGIYCHLVSMFFYTFIILGYLLLNYKIYFKKEKLKSLLIASVIIFLISLPYLVTVLEYKMLDMYTVFISDVFTYEDKVVNSVLSLKSLVINNANDDKVMVYFNYMTSILFVITTIQLFFDKNKYFKKEKIKLLIYILLLGFFISSKLIWKNVPQIFLMIQFIWRLLIPFSLLIVLYCPLCLINISNKDIKIIIYLILVLIIVKDGLQNISYYDNIEYDETDVVLNDVAMGWQREYLPEVCNDEDSRYYYDERLYEIVSSDEDVIISFDDDEFPYMSFEVSGINDMVTIELPRIYYLGYNLVDDDSNVVELYSSDNGFLAADIEKDGTYYLKYNDTFIEVVAKVISSLTFVLIIIFLVLRKSKVWIRKK